MRIMKKAICKLLVAGFFLTAAVTGSTFSADAKSGTWKQTKKGWWYSYSDGTYAKNEWVKYGGKWYYFAADGYMEKEGYRQGYWLGKDGAASTKNVGGTWKKSGGRWWFTDKTGWYPKKQWLKINGKYYYFGADGYLVTNEWIGNECVNANGQWVPNASKDWVYAYLEEAESFLHDAEEWYPYQPCFDLIYVDDNPTPELVMHVFKVYAPATVCTYHNGKVSRQSTTSYDVEYIPKGGLIHGPYLYKSTGMDGIWSLRSGTFTELGMGTYEIDYFDTGNILGRKWDGQKVSESTYNQKLNTLYKQYKGSRTVEYRFHGNEILQALNSYLD